MSRKDFDHLFGFLALGFERLRAVAELGFGFSGLESRVALYILRHPALPVKRRVDKNKKQPFGCGLRISQGRNSSKGIQDAKAARALGFLAGEVGGEGGRWEFRLFCLFRLRDSGGLQAFGDASSLREVMGCRSERMIRVQGLKGAFGTGKELNFPRASHNICVKT